MTTSDPSQPADDAARHQCGLKRRLIRAMQPMGERPRDWIRLLTPTVRRDPRVTVLCERLSTLHDAGAGVERLLCTGRLTSPVLFPPSSPPRRSGGASSGRRRGIDRRHRRRLGGESRRPRSRGKRSGDAKSISRRRRTGCCNGLIDQARHWGVRRRRALSFALRCRDRGARRGMFARSSFGFAHLSSEVFRTPFAYK
jgi:hypothetical protein